MDLMNPPNEQGVMSATESQATQILPKPSEVDFTTKQRHGNRNMGAPHIGKSAGVRINAPAIGVLCPNLNHGDRNKWIDRQFVNQTYCGGQLGQESFPLFPGQFFSH